MSKPFLKILIALAFAALVIAAGVVSTGGIAQILAFFQRGADPASALNIEPNTPPDVFADLAWLPDALPIDMQPAPLLHEQLEAVYLRAWREWNTASLRGETIGLESAFSGPALTTARSVIESNRTHGWRVTRTATAHQLQLTYLSADGLVAGLRDRAALVSEVVRDTDGRVLLSTDQEQQYTLVLMLEEGQWRIRHLRQDAAEPLEQQLPEPIRCDGCISATIVNNRPILLDGGQQFLVYGINYYPQATPWDRFWSEYNPAIIDQDLDRISTLGLNTIRIFIPFEQFGGPRVSTAMIERLTDLLDRADLRGLRVIVTLFDFRTNYDPLLWPEADRHMQTLMQQFAGRPTILAWDLKNEPDLDYRTSGSTLVNAWLSHTLRMARSYDPGQLITIGWAAPASAPTLAEHLDLVSFHFYAPAEQLTEHYTALRTAVPDRPLILGEFGLPTWNSPFFPGGHTEAEQARYYAAILGALRQTDSAGSLAWTLYDFERVPDNVAGAWPWQIGPQREMGIIRLDRSFKPAAALLQPGADLSVPPAQPWERWLKPFWLTFAATLLLVGLSLAFLAYRRRARARPSARPAPPQSDQAPAQDSAD